MIILRLNPVTPAKESSTVKETSSFKMKGGEIPILDCSLLSGPLEGIEKRKGFQEFTQNLGKAMSGIGFAYLVNHSVDPAIVCTHLDYVFSTMEN